MKEIRKKIDVEYKIKIPKKNCRLIKILRLIAFLFVIVSAVTCGYLEFKNIIGSWWQYSIVAFVIVSSFLLCRLYKIEKNTAEIRIYDTFLELYKPRNYSRCGDFYETFSIFEFDNLHIIHENTLNILVFQKEMFDEDTDDEYDYVDSLTASNNVLGDVVKQLEEYIPISISKEV